MLLLAFITYFAALLCIGFYFYKKNQTAEHFMLGDRSVNYWVTAIATQASDMGSWLFLGFPAVVFTGGMFQCWTAIGLVVGMYATWVIVAPRLRSKTAELDSLTLSSYFAHVYGDTSGTLQLVSSACALIFFLFYIASGLVGLSLVFSSAFGLSYHVGILISVITTAAYTLIGGFVAVAWCNFFQGVFLLIMILLVPCMGYMHVGGWQSIVAAAQMKSVSLSLLASPSEMLSALFLAASWGLGYFGQPHILVNFMGIDDVNNLKYARRIGILWQILVLLAAVAVGIIGIAFFAQGLPDSQAVFIDMTMILFHPFLAGLILCAIFAATLSTMDSLILVAGASIAEDIYKPFIAPKASQERLLFVSRVASIVISTIALMLAWQENMTVYGLVNYAWSGLGSTFGPLVVASLYINNIPHRVALIGLIAGAATSALWPLMFDSLPLVPAFAVGFGILWIGSKFTCESSS